MVQIADNVSRTSRTPRLALVRGGFTLIELLVASAGGLILMGFVAVVFGFYGRTVRENQAIIRMNDSLRSAAWKLRQDLQGITCDVKPWIRPEQDAGYFELIEGPLTDASAAAGSTDLVADVDDVLLFTTRGNGAGFVGKHNTTTIEADAAEVAWFCVQQPVQVDGMDLYSLHRRQLLVVGYVATSDFLADPAQGDSVSGAYPVASDDYDISFRMESSRWRANGLSDLTKRENRFLHRRSASALFPFEVGLSDLVADGTFAAASSREGEDVIIRNVLAFDVRVFDPEQPAVGYVNLGQGSASALTKSMASKSMLAGNPTYCTWSYHYEFNGLDEDGSGTADEGTDLLDNNSNGAVDDADEFETAPPYSVPLRGVEIRLRVYEPQGKQVRQVTVRHAF